ncbi:hypothetical protein SB00610_03759 [Klebsiella quasipneumoniae subsp. similipneumoniae]|nr:hypothetical protein SB00610_03759 [Klebsiella quasipneumoniae subsp. similipneumoniae]
MPVQRIRHRLALTLKVVNLQLTAGGKGFRHIAERHAILRPLRPGEARFNAAHIKRQGTGKDRLIARVAPHALRFGIGFHQRYLFFATSAETHIAERHVIDREETAGGAILWRHIGDGGAIGQGQSIQTVTVELDKFSDHAVLAQHLGDRQHQVSSGNTFAQFAAELKADHVRDQHRHRLAEHGGFRFNPAHAPAQHAEPVNHGGMGVGAHQGIRPRHPLSVHLFAPHRPSEIFQVDLVANPGARRHHAESAEGLLPPTQKCVAFVVPLHFQADVVFEGLVVAEAVDGHRVVDHQVARRKRVHLRGIAAQAFHRLAHGGQIHYRRHAGKVLHQDASRTVGDLPVGMGLFQPTGKGTNIFFSYRVTVLPAQQVLHQHLQRLGQSTDIAQLPLRQRQTVVMPGFLIDLQRVLTGFS